MDGLVFLFIVLVAVVAVGVMVISHHQQKRRTEQIQAVAERMGFSFSEGAPGLGDRLGHFRLFSQGHSRQVRNVMFRDIHGTTVTLFDYRYRTSSGKHNQTHWQTVLLVETERLQLPHFTLRPEGMFHRLAGALGYQDIDFEAHPVFSDTYLLRGHDEAQIRTLFTEEALRYYARHAGLSSEGEAQQLIVYRAGRRAEPGSMEGFLEQGLEVLHLFVEKERALDSLPLLIGSEEDRSLEKALAELDVEAWQ
jgi:hypothetical protein